MPYPKPESERRNRNAPAVDWVVLPAERVGPTPALPEGDWSDETVAWWDRLWRKPEATQWDQSGESVWRLAKLFELLLHTDSARDSATLSAEMRQIEDRHGLSGPKAWTQLRWLRSDGDGAPVAQAKPRPTRRRDPRLKALPGGKQGA